MFGRLIIFLFTMFCVAFFGFAVARFATVPDYTTELRPLKEVTLATTVTETGRSFATTDIITGGSVASGTSLPKVVAQSYQNVNQGLQQQKQDTANQLPQVQNRIGQYKTLKQADRTALQEKVTDYENRIDQIRQQIDQLTSQSEQLKKQSQLTSETIQRRRSDVNRLSDEVEMTQTEIARLQILREHLENHIHLMTGENARLKLRNQQLKAAP